MNTHISALIIALAAALPAASATPHNEVCPDTTRYDIVVAQDGSGDFTSLQEAIARAPDFRKDTTRILIHEGVYRERINISPSKTKLKMTGRGNVTIYCDSVASSKNFTGDEMGTYGSATCYIFPDDFTAENITFANQAGVAAGQAVAALTGGDRMFFKNCRFLGFQDTLFAWGLGRQYYEDCYIEGSVDFIFGPAVALFKDCEIRCNRKKGYITAPSTPQGNKYGFVFLNCDITANEDCDSCWLSRPWRDYGRTVFIECNIGGHIRPEGWNNWRKPHREQTCYYAEYGNTGAGADTSKRAFGHVLQSATGYTPAEILDDWQPAGAHF